MVFLDFRLDDLRGIRGGNSVPVAGCPSIGRSLEESFNGSIESSINWLSLLLPGAFAEEPVPEA